MFEDVVRLLQINNVRIRNGLLSQALLFIRRPQDYQLVRIAVWERRKQHRVDHAEDRRVGADSKRQRENNDQAEKGPLAKIAKSVTHILKETFHLPTHPLAQRCDVRAMMPPVPFVKLQQAVERQC